MYSRMKKIPEIQLDSVAIKYAILNEKKIVKVLASEQNRTVNLISRYCMAHGQN